MEPIFIYDPFGGHFIREDWVEVADPVAYQHQVDLRARHYLEEDLWIDLHIVGIHDPMIIRLEAYY